MAETRDAIKSLLAEFRGYSAFMPPSYHVTMSWADFRRMLDRFEAAAKRVERTHKKELETRDAVIQTEVAAREAEREAHKREVRETEDLFRKSLKKQEDTLRDQYEALVGFSNIAKLREALEKCRNCAQIIPQFVQGSTPKRSSLDAVARYANAIVGEVKAALAETEKEGGANG